MANLQSTTGDFRSRHFGPVTITITILFSLMVSNTSSKLAISPEQQSVEVGDVAIFTCTAEDGNNSAIIWTYGESSSSVENSIVGGNTNSTSTMTDNERVTNKNGTLTIANATESDDGKYYCWANRQSQDSKKEVKLVVYVMPDYEADFIVVACLCGGLLVVLVVLSLTKWVQNRKEAQVTEMADSTKVGKEEGAIGDVPGIQGVKISTISNAAFDPKDSDVNKF